MGQRERTRKKKQAAARAASVSSIRTVEENFALLFDNKMKVDAEASSAAAALADGPNTAPPGKSGGDGVVTQSAKRKEKEELKPEDVNPSGV
eukprot:2954626-Amphidinium_carterae.1